MKKFMDEDFLLSTDTAKTLYHNHAKNMPIFDYHCHLPASEIAQNKSYENITQMWLYHDHYKWRAMRGFGIDEKYITGDASDYEKFYQFAKMMPYLIGNPIYHWSHLELKKYFRIEETLNEKNAKEIWDKTTHTIKKENLTAIKLIEMSNVVYIGTTDDPVDSLEFHKVIKENKDIDFKVCPSFRPDKVLKAMDKNFGNYIETLSKVSNVEINNYNDLLKALENRLDFFVECGCTISDHSLEVVFFEEATKEEVNFIFEQILKNNEINEKAYRKYFSYTFKMLGRMYKARNIVMQLHIGAMRNNNTKMFNKIGVDCGFDSINDMEIAHPLSRLLDTLEVENNLPKTILYCLNPKDNEVLGTMIGNFQGDCIAGKIQFGSGWWFNDQKDGMIRQLTALSQLGLLSQFVGMLTDSRSFLSFTRHEYFRRILCEYIGNLVENGEYPNDIEILSEIVENICYNNAKKYF